MVFSNRASPRVHDAFLLVFPLDVAMDALTFSQVRANLGAVLDRVVDDRAPVIVTRQTGDAVVLVSLADWNAVEASLHLLSTPANAERLRQAMQELDRGAGSARTALDP
jgi:antitoxin YefM